MSFDLIKTCQSILPSDRVMSDPCECVAYSYDNSRYQGMPDVVVFPLTTQEVSELIKLSYENSIPVYARGKGSGTTGACVPTEGGMVISFEKMHNIIALNAMDRYIITQPGVTNAALQARAKTAGFFWPPDPSSSTTCTIGGNLACNAAGPRAVKYGTCRENVLGLTAVTGTGKIIKVGCRTTKGVVGYDLTRLLVGSEGTLALITEAILKLTPLPDKTATIQILLNSTKAAAAMLAQMMTQPFLPSALEFMDENSLMLLQQQNPSIVANSAKAMIMANFDGNETELNTNIAVLAKQLNNPQVISIKTAKTKTEADTLWQLRKALSPCLRSIAPKKINEDIVVPISRLCEYIDFINDLSQQYQLTIVSFGHGGNGNIHTNIMLDPDDPVQVKNSEICLEKIFKKVIELEGTLSGEHGIGIDKREPSRLELNEATIELMYGIKNVFDPKNILNPNKLIPVK